MIYDRSDNPFASFNTFSTSSPHPHHQPPFLSLSENPSSLSLISDIPSLGPPSDSDARDVSNCCSEITTTTSSIPQQTLWLAGSSPHPQWWESTPVSDCSTLVMPDSTHFVSGSWTSGHLSELDRGALGSPNLNSDSLVAPSPSNRRRRSISTASHAQSTTAAPQWRDLTLQHRRTHGGRLTGFDIKRTPLLNRISNAFRVGKYKAQNKVERGKVAMSHRHLDDDTMEESDVFEDWNAIEGSIELETPPNELIIRTRNIPQLNVECSLDLLPSPHNHPNIAVSASLPIPYPTNTTIAPQWSPSPHSCPTTSPLLWPTISPTPSQQPLSPTTPSRVPFNITIDRDEAFEWRRRKSDVGCDLPTQDPILRQREERIRRRATAESSSSRGGGGAWWLWWRKQDQAGRQWQREQRVRKSLAEGKVRQYARTLANRGLYMCGLGNHRQNLGNALGITELYNKDLDMDSDQSVPPITSGPFMAGNPPGRRVCMRSVRYDHDRNEAVFLSPWDPSKECYVNAVNGAPETPAACSSRVPSYLSGSADLRPRTHTTWDEAAERHSRGSEFAKRRRRWAKGRRGSAAVPPVEEKKPSAHASAEGRCGTGGNGNRTNARDVLAEAQRVMAGEFATKNLGVDVDGSVEHEGFTVDVIVDVETGRILGCVEYVIMLGYVWVEAVGVCSDAQGSGFGKVLMERMAQIGRWRRKDVLLYSLKDVVTFYERQGFTLTDAFPEHEWHIGRFMTLKCTTEGQQ